MRINFLHVTLIVFFFTIGGVSAKCQVSIDSVARKAIENFLALPGGPTAVSIGIVRDGKDYEFNAGEKHKGLHDAPDSRTIYYVGSITKTFTGTLLAKAVVEGKVKLDDDIRKYLDGNYPNLEFKRHYITLAQLLNHRSGLPYLMPDNPVYSLGNNAKQTYFLDSLYKHYTRASFFDDLRKVKLDTMPGTKFRYSNTSAQLCSYILEKIYGRTYDKILKDKITGRLGMNSTGVILSAKKLKLLPAGYDDKGAVMPNVPNGIGGAGAIKSSLADMLKYVRLHLDESDPAVKLTHEPTWKSGNYWAGLNWQIIETDKNRRVIFQSGNVAGFTAYSVVYPESNMAIVVLTNEEDRKSAGRIERMINSIVHSLDVDAPLLP